jgi:signal transduction histidine kinase/ABC-type amino acid transport substrate-binding protein
MTTANSELVPVITVIDKYIEAGGIDRLFDLYKKGRHEYAKYELIKSFTEDEAAYIANLAEKGLKVPIALENGNYPVSFYNKNDRKFQGIALDILSEITEMTGIEFHMATDENTLWSESLEKLNSNEVALISQLLHTPDRDGKYLWSNNYSNSHYALLSRADFPYLEMYQVVMAKVGVFRNSAYEEMYNFWFPVNNNVIYYDTAMEGINALEKGEIYLLMASENMLIAITHYLEKPGYKVNILFHTVEESYFGFNLNEEILCSIFHKTQYFIDSEKISTFWSGRIFDYSRKISQARLPWLIGVAVLFLCVIILMSLMFRRLRREGRGLETIVDERTAELNRQNSLMSTVNTAAAFLLEPGTDDDLIAINRSMGMVCQNMDTDRAHLWKNVRKDDGKLYFQQVSKWVNALYSADNKLPEFAFEDTPSFWSSLFSQGKSLNGPVDTMPENEQEFFSLYKIQSILAVPLFLEGELWGFVSFDDCHSRRYFSEADEHTLRSWGLLVMGATQRSEIMNDLKNAVDDARKASSEAENASAAKSRFLANMSHEMRTPMNVIVGLTDLMLEDGDIASDSKNNLEKINTAGNTLMGLINDVLDISKIEAGRLDLMPVQYEVASLLNDIITLNIIRIEEKPIVFKLDIDENLPCFLYGDDLRVKQILNNLLSNAFKYTKEGTVTLSVRYRREGRRKNDNIWLSFCISDTGIGIRTKDMEKLFSDYNQVDTHANRQIEGTGLGLSITRKFVDLMDGEISVESEYGRGSTFRVSISQGFVTDKTIGKETIETLYGFRYAEKSKRPHEKLVRSDLCYARVLVVDDLATNLDVTAGMLRKYKMQVDCVTGGQEAIDLVVAGDRIYDAIFMDHMMPGMDGMEAMAMLRALGTEYAQKIPIIALTANVVAGNEQMFLDNGFNAFLPKPFSVMLLDSIIQRWVRDKSRE